MRRRAEWSGAAAAAAVGAMITGHFIPHWKTEREGERQRERRLRECRRASGGVRTPQAMPTVGRPAGRLGTARSLARPHILKHVDRRKIRTGCGAMHGFNFCALAHNTNSHLGPNSISTGTRFNRYASLPSCCVEHCNSEASIMNYEQWINIGARGKYLSMNCTE